NAVSARSRRLSSSRRRGCSTDPAGPLVDGTGHPSATGMGGKDQKRAPPGGEGRGDDAVSDAPLAERALFLGPRRIPVAGHANPVSLACDSNGFAHLGQNDQSVSTVCRTASTSDRQASQVYRSPFCPTRDRTRMGLEPALT